MQLLEVPSVEGVVHTLVLAISFGYSRNSRAVHSLLKRSIFPFFVEVSKSRFIVGEHESKSGYLIADFVYIILGNNLYRVRQVWNY